MASGRPARFASTIMFGHSSDFGDQRRDRAANARGTGARRAARRAAHIDAARPAAAAARASSAEVTVPVVTSAVRPEPGNALDEAAAATAASPTLAPCSQTSVPAAARAPRCPRRSPIRSRILLAAPEPQRQHRRRRAACRGRSPPCRRCSESGDVIPCSVAPSGDPRRDPARRPWRRRARCASSSPSWTASRAGSSVGVVGVGGTSMKSPRPPRPRGRTAGRAWRVPGVELRGGGSVTTAVGTIGRPESFAPASRCHRRRRARASGRRRSCRPTRRIPAGAGGRATPARRPCSTGGRQARRSRAPARCRAVRAASAWAPASSWREISTAAGPIVLGRRTGIIRCWPCHIAKISGIRALMWASR